MSGWQPIESAPRDGSWFVTANFSGGAASDEFEIGRFLAQKWTVYEPAEGGLFRAVEKVVLEWTHDNFRRASHWMPLPEAPAAPPSQIAAAGTGRGELTTLSPEGAQA